MSSHVLKKVIVCVKHRTSSHQPSCAAKGSEALVKQIEELIAAKGWMLNVERFKCLGCCEQGINLKLAPEGPFLHGLALDNLNEMASALEAFAHSSG